MANYVINNPGVVYWVLVLLQECGYSPTTIINVTRDFIDQTVPSVFIKIGSTPNGKILVEKINQIIKCDAPGNAAAARCLKIQTVIGAVGEVGKAATGSGGEDAPRQLSDVEVNWYVNYYDTPDGRLSGRTKSFKPEICWQLPRKGIGYIVYNPDDLNNAGRKRFRKTILNDDYGYDQIGTKETVESMMRIAREWSVYPQNKDRRKLQIGDMSRPGGINTPDHDGHDTGNIVDMRPLRNDAENGDAANLNYNSPSYDQDLTKEFIRMVKTLYPSIFIRFNDGKIAGQGEFTYVHKDGNGGIVHNDHLHLEFR